MRILTLLLVTFLATASFGQTFEGKVVYKNSYKSKLPGLTDVQFATKMGTIQEYFIKDGNYKSVTNGSISLWQLYVNKDNKLYNKLSNSETLTWNDGASNPDEVQKVEVNKNVAEVLGYRCDEIVLTCKSGIQKYYYNMKLSVDSKLYSNHKFGNWYDYLSKSNALPLKSIIETAQFNMESTATEIKEMKLDQAFFALPAGAKTMKSPY